MSDAEHSASATPRSRPRIALVDWTHVLEDFLDPLGVSLDGFCEEMTGGWMFGYVAALDAAGVDTTLVACSRSLASPVTRVHRPTGARIRVLPAPRAYLAARRRILDPYAQAVVSDGTATAPGRLWNHVLHAAGPYLATPLRMVARALREDDCRAVLCQEHEHARFDELVALGRWLGIPVFSTFQGGDSPFDALQRRVRTFTLPRCAGVIAAPHEERTRLQRAYGLPSARLHAVFNPIDLALWPTRDRGEARRALGLGAEGRVVAWHGRVDWHRKGLDVLLDAWRRMVAQDPRGRDVLLLLGTGGDAPRLREAVASLPVDRVRWLDRYVNDRDLIGQCLHAADVYAFASRHEGLPVAPLEAMACARPVVACRAPGIEDILGREAPEEHGGVLVDAADASALAVALDHLLKDPTRGVRLGAAARRRIETAFAVPVVGAQLARVLLGGVTPGPTTRVAPAGPGA